MPKYSRKQKKMQVENGDTQGQRRVCLPGGEVIVDARAEWLGRPLGDLELLALFLDGIEVGEHVLVVGVGVDTTGNRHVLGVWEGKAENTIVCQPLIKPVPDKPAPDRLRSSGIRGWSFYQLILLKAHFPLFGM